MKTLVVNVRGLPLVQPLPFIYVGRGMRNGLVGHPLANPFVLPRRNVTEDEREECLAKYQNWLAHWHPSNLEREIRRLAEQVQKTGLPLGCWCAPATCHADILAKLVDHHLAAKEST